MTKSKLAASALAVLAAKESRPSGDPDLAHLDAGTREVLRNAGITSLLELCEYIENCDRRYPLHRLNGIGPRRREKIVALLERISQEENDHA